MRDNNEGSWDDQLCYGSLCLFQGMSISPGTDVKSAILAHYTYTKLLHEPAWAMQEAVGEIR
jgi:hypothetical protein